MTTIQQQIDEANREIGMRREVYARRVAKGTMRRSEADYGIATMIAIRDTLVWHRDNEEVIANLRAVLETGK